MNWEAGQIITKFQLYISQYTQASWIFQADKERAPTTRAYIYIHKLAEYFKQIKKGLPQLEHIYIYTHTS